MMSHFGFKLGQLHNLIDKLEITLLWFCLKKKNECHHTSLIKVAIPLFVSRVIIFLFRI